MSERRTTARSITLKTGTIFAAHNRANIVCAVLDVTDSGACILIPRATDTPAIFDLILDHNEIRHRCTLQWKSGNRIGVSFLTPADAERTHPTQCRERHDQV
jgi:hypothetical protein